MNDIRKIVPIIMVVCLWFVVSQAQSVALQFTEVQFADARNGWILGNDGSRVYLLTTHDSGKSWATQELPSVITKVKFLNRDFGFAIGDLGTLRSTEDGGRTWTALTSGTSEKLYDIKIVDRSRTWISGRSGTILHTTDGGASWKHKAIADEAIAGIEFSGPKTGYALGYGTIFRTIDEGRTWTSQPTKAWKQLLAIEVIDGTGFVSVNGPAILRTYDAGLSWQEMKIPVGGIPKISFADNKAGWVAQCQGGSTGYTLGSQLPGPRCSILKTIDGGNSWQIVHRIKTVPRHRGWIGDIFFINRDYGWAVGADGLTLVTQNGGRTWTSRFLKPT